MRTKTLLMAAAALAAGVISSQAQGTVYSQNVVGYVNLSVPGHTSQPVANQLDTGSNTLDNVFQGTGLISGSTEVLVWNGAGYNTYTYLNCSASPTTPGQAGFWNTAETYDAGTNTMLSPGGGVFIFNGSASTLTIPTVGQVIQGTNTYTIASGANIYSVPQPLAGVPIDQAPVNFPVISGSTEYLQWNGAGFNTYTYLNCSASPTTPGQAGFWNTAETIDEDTNPAVWPTAGGSFFIFNGGKAMTWTNVFEVQ